MAVALPPGFLKYSSLEKTIILDFPAQKKEYLIIAKDRDYYPNRAMGEIISNKKNGELLAVN